MSVMLLLPAPQAAIPFPEEVWFRLVPSADSCHVYDASQQHPLLGVAGRTIGKMKCEAFAYR